MIFFIVAVVLLFVLVYLFVGTATANAAVRCAPNEALIPSTVECLVIVLLWPVWLLARWAREDGLALRPKDLDKPRHRRG